MIRFGVIADCQYADVDNVGNVSHRYFRLAKDKLAEAVEFFNAQELEFVVQLGDLIDQKIESYDTVLPILAGLKHPLLHVLGNHDFDTGDRENHTKFELRQVLNKLQLENNYYYRDIAGVRFIVLDTNEVGTIEGPKTSENYRLGQKLLAEAKERGEANALSWNGRPSDAQYTWLESRLKEAESLNSPVVLFAHHPVFPLHKENMLESEKMHNVLSSFNNIKAYLNGHNHDGNEGVVNGVPCVTFHGMVDTEQNAYAIVELTDDRMTINGHGRQPSVQFNLR